MLRRIGKTGSGTVHMGMASDAVRRSLAVMSRRGRRIAMTFDAVGGRVSGQEGRTPRRRQDRRSRFIQSIAMAVRGGAGPGCGRVGRYEPAGGGKRAEGDRIGLDGRGAGPGPIEMIKGAESQAVVALVAYGGLRRVFGYAQAGVGGMRPGKIWIGVSCRRLGVAGGAAGWCCHRTGQVAGLAARDHLAGFRGDIRRNLVTSQAVIEVAAGRGVMVGIRHVVRRRSRTTGVAGSHLPQAVGEGDAEAAWRRGQRCGAPPADIVTEGAGIGNAARRAVRVDDGLSRIGRAPLPGGGVRLGKDMAAGAGDSRDTAPQSQAVEGGCPLDTVAVLADGLVLFGQSAMNRGVYRGRLERYRVEVAEGVVIAAGCSAGRIWRNHSRIGAAGMADGAGRRVCRICGGMGRCAGSRGCPGLGRMWR